MDVNTQAWGRSNEAPAEFGWPNTPSVGHPEFSSLAQDIPSVPAPGWMMSSPSMLSADYWQQRMPFPSAGSYPPGPGSGLSRASSKDDLTSVELEQVFEYEERFRVDRRKLELLIVGRFEPIKETAAEFFQKIGEETKTTVIWPSRLKVGAKSKKDPHIRIGGQEENVTVAKNLIMDHLDTKSRRVTMKMDVSYTDHSHIIGKGGNTIGRVMSETGCHIHFPDSNRSNPNEKSNQVSIAGREMEGVERARARVRELTPLVFSFDLPIVSSVEVNLDPNDPFLRAIQDQYNIQLMFRQKQKNFHTTMAVVKGCEWEASRVKEATLLLIDHLCVVPSGAPTTPVSGTGFNTPSASVAFPVTMNLEISPVHHAVVVGKNNFNLRVIMQRTNTTILFPDAADPNIPPIRKGSVSITGAIHNVYSARQQLIGSLPLVMMFDVPEDLEVVEADVHKIGEDLEVAISIKPKHRQGCKSVLIKAQERNASAIYAARHRLLKMEDEDEVLVVAEVPESYKVQPIPQHLLNTLGITSQKQVVPSTSFMFSAPPAHSAMPSSPINTFLNAPPANPPPISPYLLPNQTPWAGAAAASATSANFGNVLTPNHPYLQDYALLVLNNITRLQQQQLEQQQPKFDPNNNWKAEMNNNSLTAESKNHFNSPPLQGASPRNSSPVTDNGNMTNNLNITEKMLHQLSVQESETERGCASPGPVVSSPSFFSHDRRAPGCEMKSLQKQVDYDQKRLLATRAIQTKPSAGEPRTPTPSWSGLGFSNSMPENVIREKLEESANTEDSVFKLDHDPIFGNSSAFDALLQKKSGSNLTSASMASAATAACAAGGILPSDDLPTVLAKNGLAKYTDLFVRHEVDLQTFTTLTDHDLREVGIQTFGARKKLLYLISKIKQHLTDKW